MLCWHEEGHCPHRCFDSDSSFEFECFCPASVPCPFEEKENKEKYDESNN